MSVLFLGCSIIALWRLCVCVGSREMWKAGITLAGMLLFLVLIVWVPVSAAGASEEASGLATPVTGTVQATPTMDPTMTALEKEKLAQEIDQLKNQNYWSWTTIGPILVGFAGLLAALYSFITWIRNRQDEQKKREEEQDRWREERKEEQRKRDEERFQAVVEGLGSEREEAKAGAAIMLRTFLQPDYDEFYLQTFDLAVTHLRLRKAHGMRNEINSSIEERKSFPVRLHGKKGEGNADN